MSKERELLQKVVNHMWQGELVDEIKELLAQPEQEQEPVDWEKEKKSYLDEINRLGVESNRDDEEIDRLTQLLTATEQEPVAWITEWVQRYRHNDTPIMDRAVSFTKGDAPAVPNPNYIPLYASPPKHQGGY